MKYIATLIISNIIYLAAFSQAGTLDNSFSSDGKAVVAFAYGGVAGFDACRAIALQPDGKIVMAGYSDATSNGHDNFMVVRLNPDGTLDHSFNTKGYISIDFSGADDDAYAIAIQSDGKIVVAGDTHESQFQNNLALVRLLSSGVPDPSFGSNFSGKVITALGGDAHASSIAIQDDGKIVIAGSFTGTSKLCLLVRYKTGGSLDQSFGVTGRSVTNFGAGETANSLALQSNGKFVVACGTIPAQNSHFLTARFTSSGFLDNSFGTDGKVVTKVGIQDECFAVALQPNGKIVVAGDALLNSQDFVVLRYTANGIIDNTFSGDGIVTTNFGAADVARAIAIQSDYKIIVAGTNGVDFAAARFNTNGSLDKTFSTDGKTTTDFSGHWDWAYAAKIQSDGKIVVAGANNFETGNANFAIVRYHGDNAAPETIASESSDENTTTEEITSFVYIYPNPVTNVLHVEGLNAFSPSIVSITGLSGIIFLKETINEGTNAFNVSALKPGMYWLNITDKTGQIKNWRFIKQ